MRFRFADCANAALLDSRNETSHDNGHAGLIRRTPPKPSNEGQFHGDHPSLRTMPTSRQNSTIVKIATYAISACVGRGGMLIAEV